MLVDPPPGTVIPPEANAIWLRGGASGTGRTTMYRLLQYLVPGWRPGRRRWRWGVSWPTQRGEKPRVIIEPVPSGRPRHLPPPLATARPEIVSTSPGDAGLAHALSILLRLGQQRRDFKDASPGTAHAAT